MAQARDVQQGQVWADSQGRQFEVLGPQNENGFPVRNTATGRTAWKGPRALVRQIQDGSGYTGNPHSSAGIPSGYGFDGPPVSHGVMIDPTWGYGGPPTPPSFEDYAPDYEPEAPARPARQRRAPLPRPEIPVAIAGMPPIAAPIPMPPQLPAGFPSELTAHVANALRLMPAARAHSATFVSKTVAHALAQWRATHPGGY